MAVYGLVVNPKTSAPLVVMPEHDNVRIYRINGDAQIREGGGYFERGDSPVAEATGYPRSHTPNGVVTRGSGNGTCLYTGLCLTAHLQNEGVIRHAVGNYEGDGICSDENRSDAASEWWEEATRRKLASGVSTTVDHREEVDDEDFSDHFSEDRVASWLSLDEITSMTAVASGYRGEEVEVNGNIYTFDSAFEHNLVAVSFKSNVLEVFDMPLVQQIGTSDVNLAALLALNLSGTGASIFDSVVFLLQQEGASAEQMESFALRRGASVAAAERAHSERMAAASARPRDIEGAHALGKADWSAEASRRLGEIEHDDTPESSQITSSQETAEVMALLEKNYRAGRIKADPREVAAYIEGYLYRAIDIWAAPRGHAIRAAAQDWVARALSGRDGAPSEQVWLPRIKKYLRNRRYMPNLADMQEAVAEGQELRQTLGWDRLADLPDF